MVLFRTDSVLFFFVAESDLEGIIAVGILRFHLGNNARTSFNDSTSSLLTTCIEDAGHPNFFTNDSFHFSYGFSPQGCTRQTHWNYGTSILVHHPTFSRIDQLSLGKYR